MASRTLDVGTLYPDGTTLNAYVFGPYVDNPDGTPPPAATATAVSSGGTVTFTGLADGTRYYAGLGTDPWRYFGFSTPAVSTSGASGVVKTPRTVDAVQSGGTWAGSGAGAISTVSANGLTVRRKTTGTAAGTSTLTYTFASPVDVRSRMFKLPMLFDSVSGWSGGYINFDMAAGHVSGQIMGFDEYFRALEPELITFAPELMYQTGTMAFDAITAVHLDLIESGGVARYAEMGVPILSSLA